MRAAPTPQRKDFFARVFSGASEKTRLVSYAFDRRGMFTVRLSNGQTWEQLPSDVNFAHWKRAASDYNVSVSEGRLYAPICGWRMTA